MSFKEKSKKLIHFLTHRKLDTFPLWDKEEVQPKPPKDKDE